MKTSAADRRTEPRQPVQGDIRLRRTGVIAAPFMGRLMDLSPGGFRTRHSCLTLASGDRVEFEFHGRSGAARAMWTRIVDSEAETGFNILREAG
ncbi:MAG: PilZ domain-containing protein [Candidatus Solibacter sp.]|nr:PilZ domain-containing protein [Candidatus Solibacter sp.]